MFSENATLNHLGNQKMWFSQEINPKQGGGHSVLQGGQFRIFFTSAFDFLNTYISFLYV